MRNRIKVLYLTGTDPRNTSYGGEQRTHFIWKGLKKVSEVYTIVPVAHKHQERVDEADKIRWLCFERRWTLGWILLMVWARIFPRVGVPCRWDIKRLKEHYSFAFDVCVVRYVTMASFLRAWRIAPMILDIDDLLTEAFDSCHLEPLSFFQMAHRILLDWYQRCVFAKAKHMWVTNNAHCRLLERYKVSCLPNIPCALQDTVENRVSEKRGLLFVGSLCCDQNYWGIDFFLDTYWMEILEDFPELSFQIVGRGLPDRYKKKWAGYKNVTLTGFVDDLVPVYTECMCVLTPLYVGSGSALKVLEALYSGRVCLAAPYAVRGIPVETCCPENGIFIFRNKDDLVSALRVVMDQNIRRSMQINAHKLIATRFSQVQVDEAIRNTLLEISRAGADIPMVY